MMEYFQNSLLNLGNLAVLPSCFAKKNDLCDNDATTTLLCDFYLNGFPSSNLDKLFTKVQDDHPIELPSTCVASDTSYILQNGLTSLQQNDDDILFDVEATASRTASLPAVHGDISYGLFDKPSNEEIMFRGDDSNHHSIKQSHYSQLPVADDHLFEFLDKLDVDTPISENQEQDILQFDLETTFISNSASQMVQMIEEDQGFSPASSTFVKCTELETIFTDVLSPQSVDSGISLSWSPNVNTPLFDKVDLVDFLDMDVNEVVPEPTADQKIVGGSKGSTQRSSNSVSETETMFTDMFSPRSVDSGISSASSNSNSPLPGEMSVDMVDFISTTTCELDKNDDHSGIFVSIKHMDTNGNTIADSSNSGISLPSEYANGHSLPKFDTFSKMNLLLEPDSLDMDNGVDMDVDRGSAACRYTPYKCKKKTPEQKLRKKEQNRNAASKYRTKKKDEFKTVFGEVEKLEEKNKELKDTVEGLRKEIDYLKTLMLDVINTRLNKKHPDLGLGNLLQTAS